MVGTGGKGLEELNFVGVFQGKVGVHTLGSEHEQALCFTLHPSLPPRASGEDQAVHLYLLGFYFS